MRRPGRAVRDSGRTGFSKPQRRQLQQVCRAVVSIMTAIDSIEREAGGTGEPRLVRLHDARQGQEQRSPREASG